VKFRRECERSILVSLGEMLIARRRRRGDEIHYRISISFARRYVRRVTDVVLLQWRMVMRLLGEIGIKITNKLCAMAEEYFDKKCRE
jgi:hypothetical protein